MYRHTFPSGAVALFDDADATLLLENYVLYCVVTRAARREHPYVICRDRFGVNRGAHRVLMNVSDARIVDHIDGDGLNNQRANLRICSRLENNRNRRPNTNKALPKGVSARFGRFVAEIRAGDVRRYRSGFATASEAAACYAAWAHELHGAFARTSETSGA